MKFFSIGSTKLIFILSAIVKYTAAMTGIKQSKNCYFDHLSFFVQALEAEMKKLHASIKEATQIFDETLNKLLERNVKTQMVIKQVGS